MFYCSVSDKGWQEWNAQFFLPSHKKGFRYVQILFKGPKHHVDIVIDDMVLEELPLEKDWLQAVKARTEKLRKRDVTIRYVCDRFTDFSFGFGVDRITIGIWRPNSRKILVMHDRKNSCRA